MLKRLFDIVFSVLGLVLAAPVLALAALWIRLEGDGPVLFRQNRIGRGGKPFEILKFRTMLPATDESRDIGVTMFGHPRVTRASGRVLRRTKLDELPQLLNVLRGDMSFVGPRPELEKYVRLYPEDVRDEVLSVQPGITDWAALRFSDEEALLASRDDPETFYVDRILPAKLHLYVEYVRHRSLVYDLGLLLLTVLALILPTVRRRLRYVQADDFGLATEKGAGDRRTGELQ